MPSITYAERTTSPSPPTSPSLTGSGASCSDQVSDKVCVYCTGTFVAVDPTAMTCCGACRQAVSAALKKDDVDPPSIRRETWSKHRRAATGYGLITRRAAYEGDLRVRALCVLALALLCRELS